MNDDSLRLPEIVSREEWLIKRNELLEEEKVFTHQRDRLNARRRRLPMVKIDKEYIFKAPEGNRCFLDLFEERLQLIIYHFMWLYDKDMGCPSCSAFADHIARGHLTHLHERETTLALVSRAPISKIESFKKRMGWTLPWYSSYESDFNYDFNVTFDESVMPLEYNYLTKAELVERGFPPDEWKQPFDLHGISCFLRDGDNVYHTYSTYARGTETVGGAHYFLDLTALGRQEAWEEPKSRSTGRGAKAGNNRILYPDEYKE